MNEVQIVYRHAPSLCNRSDRKYSVLKCRLHDIHTVLIFICNFGAKDECEHALLESTNYFVGS